MLLFSKVAVTHVMSLLSLRRLPMDSWSCGETFNLNRRGHACSVGRGVGRLRHELGETTLLAALRRRQDVTSGATARLQLFGDFKHKNVFENFIKCTHTHTHTHRFKIWRPLCSSEGLTIE